MDQYLAVIATLLAAAVIVRVAGTGQPVLDLDPQEAGYLAGGARRAVQVAVAVLRRHGAVAVARVGKIKRLNTARRPTGRLPAAIFATLVTPKRAREVERDREVRRALTAVRARLVEAGLYVSPLRRGSCAVLAAGVLVVGLARPVEEPLGWPNLLVIAATTEVAVLLWRTARRTGAGARTLRALRERFPVPDDDEEPPPETAGMMVALHGRLDLGDIENITARPTRRGRDTEYSTRGHHSSTDHTLGGSDYSTP